MSAGEFVENVSRCVGLFGVGNRALKFVALGEKLSPNSRPGIWPFGLNISTVGFLEADELRRRRCKGGSGAFIELLDAELSDRPLQVSALSNSDKWYSSTLLASFRFSASENIRGLPSPLLWDDWVEVSLSASLFIAFVSCKGVLQSLSISKSSLACAFSITGTNVSVLVSMFPSHVD